MRKSIPENPELNEEEMATEMIELACEDLDGLTEVFAMLSRVCDELQREVEEEGIFLAPDELIH